MEDQQQSKVLGLKLTVPIEFEVIFDPNTGERSEIPRRIIDAEAKLRTPEDGVVVGSIGGAVGGAFVADICGFHLSARPLESWRAIEEKLLEHRDIWAEKRTQDGDRKQSSKKPKSPRKKKSSGASAKSSKDQRG